MKSRPLPGSRTILIIAPQRVTLLDLVGPYEVFCRAARRVPGSYQVVVASADSDRNVTGKFGLSLTCDLPLSRAKLPVDTVIVAGSEVATDGPRDPALLQWLRKASTRGISTTTKFDLTRASDS